MQHFMHREQQNSREIDEAVAISKYPLGSLRNEM
jgi:hypothetical protein